jgi:hypothetical protein
MSQLGVDFSDPQRDYSKSPIYGGIAPISLMTPISSISPISLITPILQVFTE